MIQKQESPGGKAGALECHAWRLDASEYTRSPHGPQALAGPRQERQIEHLHRLGPRVLAELLGDIATSTGQHELIADRVEAHPPAHLVGALYQRCCRADPATRTGGDGSGARRG